MFNIIRLIFAGAVATTAMTVFMQNANRFGLAKVNIPGVLGSPATPDGEDAQENSSQWKSGLLVHYILGSLVFPFTFDLIGKHVMPGRSKVQKASAWGAGLWAVGENVIMPMFDREKEFKRAKVAKSYGLAHLVYGLIFGLLTKR